MKRLLFSFFSIILLISGCKHDPIMPIVTEQEACDLGYVDFTNTILPLLQNSCATTDCHDEITHEEGLIITSYTNIMNEEELVTARDYKKSKLYEVITKNPNNEDFMPPSNSGIAPLTPTQIQWIKDWILQGAMKTDCGCDTTSFSFATDVFPIFEKNCIPCHNGNHQNTSYKLTNFSEISASVISGNTLDRINSNTSDVMPQSGKMDDCKIRIIEKWIENGAPND